MFDFRHTMAVEKFHSYLADIFNRLFTSFFVFLYFGCMVINFKSYSTKVNQNDHFPLFFKSSIFNATIRKKYMQRNQPFYDENTCLQITFYIVNQ